MTGREFCGWLMAHRDKHACGCQCRLADGHKGRHQCERDLATAVVAGGSQPPES